MARPHGRRSRADILEGHGAHRHGAPVETRDDDTVLLGMVLLAWVAGSVLLALVLGAVLAGRNRQVPRPPALPGAVVVPAARDGHAAGRGATRPTRG